MTFLYNHALLSLHHTCPVVLHWPNKGCIICLFQFQFCVCSLHPDLFITSTSLILWKSLCLVNHLHSILATGAQRDLGWCSWELLLYLWCRWNPPLQFRFLISLIILVMMWINYQLNSWSHKSAVDLLCTTGCYSLGGEVNTHLSTHMHTHTQSAWYSAMLSNRLSKWVSNIYNNECTLTHAHTHNNYSTYISKTNGCPHIVNDLVRCIWCHLHSPPPKRDHIGCVVN